MLSLGVDCNPFPKNLCGKPFTLSAPPVGRNNFQSHILKMMDQEKKWMPRRTLKVSPTDICRGAYMFLVPTFFIFQWTEKKKSVLIPKVILGASHSFNFLTSTIIAWPILDQDLAYFLCKISYNVFWRHFGFVNLLE